VLNRKEKLWSSVSESLYAVLDGIEWNTVHWQDSQPVTVSEKEEYEFQQMKKKAMGNDFYVVVGSADNAQMVAGWSASARNRTKAVDERNMVCVF
jgi:hypothetical protein